MNFQLIKNYRSTRLFLNISGTTDLNVGGTFSNFKRIQSFLSKVLQNTADAPFYLTNSSLHNVITIPSYPNVQPDTFPETFADDYAILSSNSDPKEDSLTSPLPFDVDPV